jgi:hypothetical protein
MVVNGAQVFFDGPLREITADPGRRPISRREFVEAHFAPGARPFGHGFSERNRRDGTAYYAWDTTSATGQPVRFVALDTTCLLGGADGAVDVDQARWAESVLREAHSVYLAPDGTPVAGHGQDRPVILISHHGLDTLTNHRGYSGDGRFVDLADVGPDGAAVPVVPPTELEAMVHRYPNVVLWLNGHTHTNGVRARTSPHRRPDGAPGGFWEVTTCSIVDWPGQSRIVELVSFGEHGSHLAVACTMLDHDSPLDPGPAITRVQLAALHRELAGNVPLPGYGTALAGTRSDRNVILPVPTPGARTTSRGCG